MSFSGLTLSTLAITGVATCGIIAASNFSPFSKSKKDTNTKKIYEIENGGDIEDEVVIDFLKKLSKESNDLSNRFKKLQDKGLVDANIGKKYLNILDNIDKLKNLKNINENEEKFKEIKQEVEDVFSKSEKN